MTQVPVGVLPFTNVNACVIKAPNGEPLIAIEVGLFSMSHFFSETLSLVPVISAAYGEQSAVSHLTSAYRFILDYYRRSGTLVFPRPPEIAVPPESQYFAVATAGAIECFVLCHEIAHVWLGHLSQPTRRVVALHAKGAPLVDVYQMARSQELAADGVGIGLYLWACDKMPLVRRLPPDYREAAPFLFFQLTGLVEANLGGPHKFATHPSTRRRVANALVSMRVGGANEEAIEAATDVCKVALNMPVLDRNRYVVAVGRIVRSLFSRGGL